MKKITVELTDEELVEFTEWRKNKIIETTNDNLLKSLIKARDVVNQIMFYITKYSRTDSKKERDEAMKSLVLRYTDYLFKQAEINDDVEKFYKLRRTIGMRENENEQ